MAGSGVLNGREERLLPRPTPGVHQEAIGPDGAVRGHWRGFLDWLGELGTERRAAMARDLERSRAESGIAFSAREQADTAADPLPVILSAADWAEVEAGVIQRARLAEATLADIYGPSRMIRDGALPPGLVYGADAFAAHCAGWPQPPARYTYVYEADIARTAEGAWVCLADRLDTPLGDGWLIANRIATSQCLAQPFLDLGVRRVASHYARFQELLDSLTGWEGRLALLTRGEGDPRFFSHAYLARYLNAALVEPGDVTVREGAAFVKTLDGLKKIDVMLRGAPDKGVDALHRQADALPGAPALSLAARAGNLVMGNAIGCSVMAHRAMAPFAHVLAERLLSEDLRLHDAPCLWMGDPAARETVLADRSRWAIDPLNRRATAGDRAALADEENLAEAFRRKPERYIALRIPRLAETPVLRGGRVAAAPWIMRVFACWTGEGWSVAPSGVAAEIAQDTDPTTGGGGRVPALGFGKDVWVMADREDLPSMPSHSLLADRLATGHLRRTGRDLLSRVADEVFWMGRNAERAEGTLRVLDVCMRRYLSGNRTDAGPDLLVDIISSRAADRADLSPAQRFRDAVSRLVNDPVEPFGMPSILSALSAGAVRARLSISEEGWRYIERLSNDPRWGEGLSLRRSADLMRLVEDSLRNLAAFSGAAQDNLTRNFAWRFLEMGRRIERGIEVARIARRLAGEEEEDEESRLRAWLTLSDSTAAYRNRYMMVPRAAAVLDLLVLDEANPRALAYQLVQLEAVLAQLPREGPYRRAEHRLALSLLTELRMLDADALADTSETGTRTILARLMRRCERDLAEIADRISNSYFAHAEAPVALRHAGRTGAEVPGEAAADDEDDGAGGAGEAD
ncbi:MAG: circularly permuted type 2 ATP-grasp protein [Pseudomonadota bacterium]